MSCGFDDLAVGGQLIVGAGKPAPLGVGLGKVRGSAYVEGPLQVGAANAYVAAQAALLVGKLKNSDAALPQYSLWSKGDSKFEGNIFVTSLAKAVHIECAVAKIGNIKGNSLKFASKSFLIDHPTKDGMKLEYGCLEGPEHSVYCRGKLVNKTVIELPDVWTGLVDESTITVSLTPVGAHQDIIVKRIGDNKVFLQSKGGIPINCFYHVFATRKDIPKLITEYPKEQSNG